MEYGLIGKKLEHSYSPYIHRCFGTYRYDLAELAPDELQAFFEKKAFKGINVTIPYKEAVLPYIDEISLSAKAVGAVNTVVNRNGKLYGYNTDVFGMCEMLKHHSIELAHKRVLILGTGGTSKTASAVAEMMNAGEIKIESRKENDGYVLLDKVYDAASDSEIIINTTPVGMFPQVGGELIDINRFPNIEGYVDAIYNPLRTDTVLKAQANGIKCCGGLYMLAAQGAMSYSIFFDKPYDDALTLRAYQKTKKKKENVVLIGMPTSGKTTHGRLFAMKLNKPFYDTDTLIEEKTHMRNSDFIEKFGEAEFRKIEGTVIKEVSAVSAAVISVGGGAILDESNINALKRNGRLVFINRQLNDLLASPSRPLTATREALSEVYDFRLPKYLKYADVTVSFTKDINNNIKLLFEALK